MKGLDPLGLRGGIDPYLYVRGNPLQYRDPLGMDAVFDGNPGAYYPPPLPSIPSWFPTGVFGFGSFTQDQTVFGPVRGAIEEAVIGGVNIKNGWFTSNLFVSGVEVGSHETYGGVFVGTEVTKDGCEKINIYEGQIGKGIPGLAGYGVGAGYYRMPDSGEEGVFFFANGKGLSGRASIGGGLSW